ncbi:gpi ethanolamine phosphate transferase 3 [Phytophthora cinnamomi]|uniref:gpi ethanolamine phosphate transferase 3 n=1 Tax=Phytophthora cinnamomi TaxID=4785 RepID=UPI003559C514|nr:gpi ethanolamine phosphate transferase 3 [Phytophthora cinnamomi]
MGHRVLAALLALHAAALYLFTTGFFLTRFEVSDLSSCQASPSDTNSSPAHLRGGHEDLRGSDDAAIEGCWMPRRFRRVVFVVIDALRFDFAAAGSSAQRSTFYSDRLPILNDMLVSEPEHALLLKFVADPPTMTMQRLKGLTTGSLPTFLDIKDNMAASSQIVEDNLLRQLREQQRGVVFMGDDTWDALYAREFTRKFAFDSFNVKDLHSVDRGVTTHLFPELHKPDWDLLIAHFLGVDHVGHTHGPSSVFMAEKLDEMNGVLKKLLQELKEMPGGEDVLLAVLGDHGMSADGNHGGASDEETGAALFLYSKTSLVATGGGSDNEDSKELRKYAQKIFDNSREVPQVDLVPTLALLSGLPIPFGNLGSVIPSLFFVPPQSQTSAEGATLSL